MIDQSLRQYLKEYKSSVILSCIAAVFLAGLLWHLYPIFHSCCDAADYWGRSNSPTRAESPGISFRTFIYPTLIAISRFLPKLLKAGVEPQLMALSVLQLCIHFIASASLGYTAYSLTQNKVITTWAIYIYTLDIFLLAQSNQVLTDSVAVSFLTIAIALVIVCLGQTKQRSLPIVVSGLVTGALPLIRPSLVLGSITLAVLFTLIYCYKHKFSPLSFSLTGLYSFCFLTPLAIQIWLVPGAIQFLQDLGRFQTFHGAYIFKYITIVVPTPYGYTAISQSMKTLVQVCETLSEPTSCIKSILLTHPLQALGHYAVKFLTVNDQVYLTTYVMDFHAPERQIWRLISCLFNAISVFGAFTLTRRGIKGDRQHLIYALISGTMISVLILPFIVGAPEERFGLTFHPFLALFVGYFVNDFLTYSRQAKLRVLGFQLILAFLLFIFSLRVESLFTSRMNG